MTSHWGPEIDSSTVCVYLENLLKSLLTEKSQILKCLVLHYRTQLYYSTHFIKMCLTWGETLTHSAWEYTEMHFIYGYCNDNGSAAAREYRDRYPNRQRYPVHRILYMCTSPLGRTSVLGQSDRTVSGWRFSLAVDREE